MQQYPRLFVEAHIRAMAVKKKKVDVLRMKWEVELT